MFEQNTSNSLKEFLYEYKNKHELKGDHKKMEKDERGNDK